jgi:glycosyltransferase involved in cell wall biosynthesis
MKWYKGLDSYLELATRCGAADHEIRFVLALNADEWEVGLFRKHFRIPANVQIVVRPPSLYAYYEVADLVVNLSHREGWIETFGLTLLEAMACGVPVVAPREGGCTEVVTDNAGGWLIDSKDIDGLLALILRLQADSKFWLHHSQHARRNAERFRESTFKKQLLQLFERVP